MRRTYLSQQELGKFLNPEILPLTSSDQVISKVIKSTRSKTDHVDMSFWNNHSSTEFFNANEYGVSETPQLKRLIEKSYRHVDVTQVIDEESADPITALILKEENNLEEEKRENDFALTSSSSEEEIFYCITNGTAMCGTRDSFPEGMEKILTFDY